MPKLNKFWMTMDYYGGGKCWETVSQGKNLVALVHGGSKDDLWMWEVTSVSDGKFKVISRSAAYGLVDAKKEAEVALGRLERGTRQIMSDRSKLKRNQ